MIIDKAMRQTLIGSHLIDLVEIEKAINDIEHITFNRVLAVENDLSGKKLVCYFAPSQEYLSSQSMKLYNNQVAQWEKIYNEEYKQTENCTDEEFNIGIFKDSFTGGMIPDSHLREWLKNIIDIILSNKPRKVLEIGTGTGLIYFQLAPYIEHYIGYDISKVSTENVLNIISKNKNRYPKTDLFVGAGHNIELPANWQPDTVVINGVTQHFPGEEYLTDIIIKSIAHLKGKGKIFIGDIQHYDLLKLFKARLLLQKLSKETTMPDLLLQIQNEISKDSKFYISPLFFYRLQSTLPQISFIETFLNKGDLINEMSLYRYHVVLHINTEMEVLDPAWLPWNNGASYDTLFDGGQRPEHIFINNVPNPKFRKEIPLFSGLTNNNINNVEELMAFMEAEQNAAEEEMRMVENLLFTAANKGYHCRLLTNPDPLMMNVVLTASPSNAAVTNFFPLEETTGRPVSNFPLFQEVAAEIENKIKSVFAELYPACDLQPECLALENMPLTNMGEIDDMTLLKQFTGKALKEPKNEIENAILQIWKNVLKIPQIGTDQNFFELGGHSLLASRIGAHIKKQYGLTISLETIFRYNTIADLSNYIHIMRHDENAAQSDYQTIEL